MSERSCPLGWECPKCKWFIKLRGMNPQTGQEVDTENCAISFLPILLIENSKEQRTTADTVADFRDSMIKGNGQLAQIMAKGMLTHED